MIWDRLFSRRWDRFGFVVALALSIAAGAALAHSTRAGAVQVGHAWALPSPEGLRETAGFVPLLAQGAEDRLLRVTTGRAERVEIRRTDPRGQGVVLDTLRLQAGAPIGMRPGALHLAFIGLDRPWAEGDRIPIVLEFEKGGRATIDLWIERAPYATPSR